MVDSLTAYGYFSLKPCKIKTIELAVVEQSLAICLNSPMSFIVRGSHINNSYYVCCPFLRTFSSFSSISFIFVVNAEYSTQ